MGISFRIRQKSSRKNEKFETICNLNSILFNEACVQIDNSCIANEITFILLRISSVLVQPYFVQFLIYKTFYYVELNVIQTFYSIPYDLQYTLYDQNIDLLLD